MPDELFEECFQHLAPRPELSISEWADTYRYLSSETSSRPGRWRTSFAPFQCEIMDVALDPAVERIVVRKPSQVGISECANNICGYYMHWEPSSILFLQPTEALAEEYSIDRIAPMIRATPELNRLIAKSRAQNSLASNKILHKRFPGGRLIFAGANSPAQLASRSVRVLIGDERDRMRPTTEGDAFAIAEERTGNFWNRKIIEFSSPTHKGASNIDKAFEKSDKRYFYLPCPYCGTEQILLWKYLEWESKDGEHYPQTAKYRCIQCEKLIPERHKPKMLRAGKWIAHAKFKGCAGFHLNALYAPWRNRRWEKLVEKYLVAKRNEAEMQVWVNTTLAESYRPSADTPEWQRLYERREDYVPGTFPDGACFLTAGVDVQHDRLHMEVVAWGPDLESWSVNYIVISGDTADESSEDSPWEKLTEEIRRSYDGVYVKMVAIDSGDQSQVVYRYVKRFSPSKVIAVKGYDNIQSVLEIPKKKEVKSSGKKKLARGLKVWGVGSSHCKTELYGFLKQTAAGKKRLPYGYCHFPKSYGESYFKELTAEVFAKKVVKGFFVYYWEKIRANEALDCRNYARAAAQLCGVERLQPGEVSNPAAIEPRRNPAKTNIEPIKQKTEQKKRKKHRQREKSPFWSR